MIANLLCCLVRNSCNLRVAPTSQALQKEQVIAVEKKLSNHGPSEIAIGQLHQVQVAPLSNITQVGQIIFRPTLTFSLTRGRKPQPGMAVIATMTRIERSG